MKGDKAEYFKATGGEHLSADFKDLFLRMVAYDPKKRISAAEIRAHPWMNKKNLGSLSVEVQQYKEALVSKTLTD